jgi:hypothetical protein
MSQLWFTRARQSADTLQNNLPALADCESKRRLPSHIEETPFAKRAITRL